MAVRRSTSRAVLPVYLPRHPGSLGHEALTDWTNGPIFVCLSGREGWSAPVLRDVEERGRGLCRILAR